MGTYERACACVVHVLAWSELLGNSSTYILTHQMQIPVVSRFPNLFKHLIAALWHQPVVCVMVMVSGPMDGLKAILISKQPFASVRERAAAHMHIIHMLLVNTYQMLL